MNQFFGCDVLQSSITIKKPKKSFLRRKKPNTMNINGRQVDIESQRKEPLLKRIFSSKEFSQFDIDHRKDTS